MNIIYSLAFVAGTLFNPITPIGILVIGVFSKTKKISFVLGLIWGLGFMVLDINGLQVMQRKIPGEIYLIPLAYGFLTLFITWLKTLLVKRVAKTSLLASPIPCTTTAMAMNHCHHLRFHYQESLSVKTWQRYLIRK